MPGEEVDEDLEHSEAHEDEAEEHADEESSSGASAAAAERNESQAGAIVGRHRRGGVILSAPPMLAPPTRQRRGGVVLSAPPIPAPAEPGHRRGHEPILGMAGPLGRHRRGAPLIGGESTLAKESGIGDKAASAEYTRKQAQQGMRIGPAQVADSFSGHSGGERVKQTKAGWSAERDPDALMRKAMHGQRQTVQADLAALGPGRAPGYRGKDEASADMRSIVEDPRFAKQYAVDRASDHGGAVGRFAAEKMSGIKEFLGSDDKAKQAGKYAARSAVRALPLVGTGAAFGGAYKDHKRAGVDDEVAGNAENDELTRATATGLADAHRNNRNKEAVAGVVGLAKDVTTVATGGLGALIPGMPGGEHAAHAAGSLMDRGHAAVAKQMAPAKLAEKAAWKAGKKGGTGINKGADWFNEKRKAHELRKDAVAPSGTGRKEVIQERTDEANEGALALAAGDGKFGAKLLNHLNAPAPAFAEPGLEHDAALPRVLSAARQVDPRDNKKAEHNLQPSQVSRMIRGEQARQSQKDRMGGALGKLTDNEGGRSFWEKSAGVDVRASGRDVTPYSEAPAAAGARAKAKEAALAHSLAPTPEHDEDEDEAEE